MLVPPLKGSNRFPRGKAIAPIPEQRPSKEILRKAHNTPKPTTTHPLHKIPNTLRQTSLILIPPTPIIPTPPRRRGRRMLAHKEAGQANASNLSDRGQRTRRNQRHDDQEKHLDRVPPRIVVHLAEHVLQLVQQPLDQIAPRGPLVVRRAAAVRVAAARGRARRAVRGRAFREGPHGFFVYDFLFLAPCVAPVELFVDSGTGIRYVPVPNVLLCSCNKKQVPIRVAGCGRWLSQAVTARAG